MINSDDFAKIVSDAKVAFLVFAIRVKTLQRALIGLIIFLSANHEAQRYAPVQPLSVAADVEKEPP